MDERNRRAQLERLTAWARVGFAALCCERLLPAYAGFAQATGWGDGGVLRQALDRVWARSPAARPSPTGRPGSWWNAASSRSRTLTTPSTPTWRHRRRTP